MNNKYKIVSNIICIPLFLGTLIYNVIKISYFVPEHVVGLLMKYNLNTRLQYLSRCHIAEAPWSPSMIIIDIFICDAGCAVDTVKLSSELCRSARSLCWHWWLYARQNIDAKRKKYSSCINIPTHIKRQSKT